MVLLSWKWAWIIKAVSCTHIFLRNVLLLYSWQLPKRKLQLAKDERSQWDLGVVPQCCICVEILLSRIQMFLLLLRDVYSHILQYHQLLGHAFTLLDLICTFLDSFLGEILRLLAALVQREPIWSLQPPEPTTWEHPHLSFAFYRYFTLQNMRVFWEEMGPSVTNNFSMSSGLIKKWSDLSSY